MSPPNGRALVSEALVTPGIDCDSAQNVVQCQSLPLGVRVPFGGQADPASRDAGRVDAGIHANQLREAARQQSRSHHQHERHRDFDGHERAAEPQRGGAHRRRAAALLERLVRMSAGGEACREEPEQQAGQGRHGRGECKHGDVHVNVAEPGKASWLCGDQRSNSRVCESDTQRAANQRVEKVLYDEKPRDARLGGSQRPSQRDLSPARSRAAHDQIGDVDAGNEQHAEYGPAQHS